jgi:hypothetical protein
MIVSSLIGTRRSCSIRLKNIEETEKAKRVLFEAKSAKKEEDEFAADRCKLLHRTDTLTKMGLT